MSQVISCRCERQVCTKSHLQMHGSTVTLGTCGYDEKTRDSILEERVQTRRLSELYLRSLWACVGAEHPAVVKAGCLTYSRKPGSRENWLGFQDPSEGNPLHDLNSPSAVFSPRSLGGHSRAEALLLVTGPVSGPF